MRKISDFINVVSPDMRAFSQAVSHVANSVPLNPLAYHPSLAEGVGMIQSEASGNTISTAMPVHIYIPAGTHILTAPITINRHNVTLTVDGGARLVPPSNQAALVFDGTQTPETYLKNWGLVLHGVIWPSSTGGSSQHGVVLRHAQHGTMYANEIRALGGSGLVFDGNNFSNKIEFNRIHGCAGWAITRANTPADANPHTTSTLISGEIQTCTLGGADLFNWFGGQIFLRCENFSGGVDCIVVSDSRNLRVSGYFENPSNTTGNDVKLTGVTVPCDTIVLDHLDFYTQMTSVGYNINIVAGTCNGIYLRQMEADWITARFLNIGGGGNTRIIKYPEANYQSGAVTNGAGAEYKSVTMA